MRARMRVSGTCYFQRRYIMLIFKLHLYPEPTRYKVARAHKIYRYEINMIRSRHSCILHRNNTKTKSYQTVLNVNNQKKPYIEQVLQQRY